MSLATAISDVVTAIGQAIKGKQDKLVSGTNIKTINSTSILGSGDITISGGSPSGNTGSIQYNNAGSFKGATNVKIDNGDIVISENSSPSAPVTGNVKIFAKSYGKTRMLPAFVDPSGMDVAVQPAMWRQKIGFWNASGGVATVPGIFGFPAFTAVGTATVRAFATTNLFTRMSRIGYVSGATKGALTSLYHTVAQFTTGTGTGLGGFYFETTFGYSDPASVATARSFIGMSSLVSAPTNIEPNTMTNCIGIAQLSTDGTQLYIVYGGSTAQTAIALGAGFPPYNGTVGITTGVPYRFSIWSPPSVNGEVNWQVERLDTGTKTSGTLTGVVGTAIPASTTLMAIRAWRTNNTTAAAVGMDVSQFYTETDY